MSFASQHYHCCPNVGGGGGDATLSRQNEILAAIAAVSMQIDNQSSGSGTATEDKQDDILAETRKINQT